jgi:hypothetical protein
MWWTGVEGLVVAEEGCWWEGVESDVGSDSVVEKDVFTAAKDSDGWRSTSEVSKVMSTVFGCVILMLLFRWCRFKWDFFGYSDRCLRSLWMGRWCHDVMTNDHLLMPRLWRRS